MLHSRYPRLVKVSSILMVLGIVVGVLLLLVSFFTTDFTSTTAEQSSVSQSLQVVGSILLLVGVLNLVLMILVTLDSAMRQLFSFFKSRK